MFHVERRLCRWCRALEGPPSIGTSVTTEDRTEDGGQVSLGIAVTRERPVGPGATGAGSPGGHLHAPCQSHPSIDDSREGRGGTERGVFPPFDPRESSDGSGPMNHRRETESPAVESDVRLREPVPVRPATPARWLTAAHPRDAPPCAEDSTTSSRFVYRGGGLNAISMIESLNSGRGCPQVWCARPPFPESG